MTEKIFRAVGMYGTADGIYLALEVLQDAVVADLRQTQDLMEDDVLEKVLVLRKLYKGLSEELEKLETGGCKDE